MKRLLLLPLLLALVAGQPAPAAAQQTMGYTYDSYGQPQVQEFWIGNGGLRAFGNVPVWDGEPIRSTETATGFGEASITAPGSLDIPLPTMWYGSDGTPVPVEDIFFTVDVAEFTASVGPLQCYLLLTYTAGSPTFHIETQLWSDDISIRLEVTAYALRPETPVAVRQTNGIGEVKSMYEE